MTDQRQASATANDWTTDQMNDQMNDQLNDQMKAQTDAMMAFWREAWTRTAAGASPQSTGGGPDPMAGVAAWMPSPEAVKRMQGAFLDAMAGSAEQYMRSPQFLDSMRQSLESAISMRTQMEEFLRKNMGDSLRTPGEASAQVLMALTEIESRIHARFDEIEARLDRIAGGARSAGAQSAAGKTTGAKSVASKTPSSKPPSSPSKSTTRGSAARVAKKRKRST